MSTAANSLEPRIKEIRVTEDQIIADLMDGRTISIPLTWSWRLSEATPEQRSNFEIIGDGHGVHWPDIDEDISAEGMLHGIPARRPRQPKRPGSDQLLVLQRSIAKAPGDRSDRDERKDHDDISHSIDFRSVGDAGGIARHDPARDW